MADLAVTVFGRARAQSAFPSTVTALVAVHRGGQTFLTGLKNSGASGSTTYAIRRSASPITSPSDGTLIATLTADSYRLLYDDSATQNLTSGLIVTDGGAHLASTVMLLVVTTGLAETGTWYYAAFTSDNPTAVVAGVNTTGPVAETYQAIVGAVRIATVANYGGSGRTAYEFMRWEPYATWNHTEWGYYGHRYTVLMNSTGAGDRPLILSLHAAGDTNYHDAAISAGTWNTDEIVVAPVDLAQNPDPYTGTNYSHSKWIGRMTTATGLYMTCTEDRVMGFLQSVRDNLAGDVADFGVDAERLYVYGASLGAAAMHYVAHAPDVFAAGAQSIGWTTDDQYGPVPNNTVTRVNSGGGLTAITYNGMAYYAATTALRPITHSIGCDDGAISQAATPAVLLDYETYHQPYAVQWKSDGHSEFGIATDYPQWFFRRFVRNEAYPAFGTASTSNTPESGAAWGPGSADPVGQRNGTLDWQSSRHSISGGSAISDGATTFAISLISSASATGVTLTIRNAQAFLPGEGATITWSTDNAQSGSATRNSDGSVTLTGLSIPTSAIRLTVTF
jgi:hypothetical protein